MPTVYVKLAANGIGKGFKQYDGIEISGLSGNEQLKKLNGSQILYGADESSIVIVGLIDQAAEVTSGTVKTARRVPGYGLYHRMPATGSGAASTAWRTGRR